MLKITIPSGTTLREAMKMIHYQSHAWQVDLELRTLEAQRLELRQLSKFTEFLERVRADVEHPESRYNDLDLDLSDIIVPGTLIREQLEAKMKAVFLKTVEAAANAKKSKDEADRKKALEKNKVVEKTVQSTPKELFNTAVDQRVTEI